MHGYVIRVQTPPCYRFGAFRLDVATRSLSRDGDAVPVAARTFDCIRFLIEHRHRAVGRDELITALWGHPEVSDGVLGQTILLARRALEDTGKDQQYIRTVQRFGYHWQAVVEVAPATHAGDGAANAATSMLTSADVGDNDIPLLTDRSGNAAATTRPGRRRVSLLIAGAALLALLAMVTMLVTRPPSTPTAIDEAANERLLVRPFQVQGDDRLAWFRLGGLVLVGEQLREHGLPVVASGTSVALAEHLGGNTAAQPWLEPGNAGRLVDGKARRRGQRWQLELVVSSAGGETQHRVRDEGEDLLLVARRASQRLARMLGGEPADSDVLADNNDEALAREIESALLTGQTRQAARLLAQTSETQRDTPRLQLAQAMLAWLNGEHDAAAVIWRHLLEQLDPARDQALIAEALNGLGVLHFSRGEQAQAIHWLDQAIAAMDSRHPTLGQALNNRALAHSALADDAEARRDFAEARAVLEANGDSLTLVNVDLGSAMHALAHDRLPEALPILDRVADDYAAFGHRLNELNARMHAARTRWLLLDPAGAMATVARMATLEEALADSAWRHYSTLVHAQILLDGGHLAQARTLLTSLDTGSIIASDPSLAWQLASQQAALAAITGNHADVLEHAEQAGRGRAQGAMQRRLMAQSHLLAVQHGNFDASHDTESTDRALTAFEHWVDEDRSAIAGLYLAIARGEQARRQQRHDEARRHFEHAMQLADAGRVPRDLLVAAAAFVDFLLDAGQAPQAQLVAERIAGWANQHYLAALIQLRVYHALGRIDAWRSLVPRVQALAEQRDPPAQLLIAPETGSTSPAETTR